MILHLGRVVMFFCILIVIALAAMCLSMYLRREKYHVTAKQSILLALLSAMMGMIGTRIMYFLENGTWAASSFFGAVLFFPPLLFPLAKLFKLKLSELLDYATPPGMAMLAFFRVNCLHNRCCGGTVIWYTAEGVPVFFPSQIVEMIVAIFIAAYLYYKEYKNNCSGELYARCIVLYGMTRFVLNLLRWEQASYVWILPAGNFWSLVAIVIGTVWLCVVKIRRRSLSHK